jgi:hypothetical protein
VFVLQPSKLFWFRESMMSHWRYESEDTNGERHRLGNYQRVARHYMGYKMAIFYFFFNFPGMVLAMVTWKPHS